MTDEKINQVLDRYTAFLHNLGANGLLHNEDEHLLEMIPKMRAFLLEGRREKVFRWLGFMQGVFYVFGYFTIEEMANHNRPDDEPKEVPPSCECIACNAEENTRES